MALRRLDSWRCIACLLGVLLAWSGCGSDAGSPSGVDTVTSESHCGKAENGETRCGCNRYCQNTSCGLCRSVNSGLVAEPPSSGQTNCVNGVAAGYPCHNVDLMSFLPLSTIGGGSGNDVWGWTDPLNGREYALMGRSTGTSFVDITDAAHPVYLGNLPTHSVNSLWRGIKVYANHAFIGSEASGHGLQIFDLTRLRNVSNPPVTFTEDGWYNGFGNSHNIAVNEASGFVYATGTNSCNGGLHMIDVHDPDHPVFAGCVGGDGYVHDALCVVYSGPDVEHQGEEICFNSNEDTVTLVDVSVKNAPIQLSRTGYPGSGYTHQGWLTADQRYFLQDDELDEVNFGNYTRTYIWDMSNLEAPQFLGHFTSARPAIDHNLFIRDGHAFQSNYRAGLRILRLDDPGNIELTEVGYFDIYPPDDEPAFNGTWNNYPFFPSGTVVVSGIEQGLYVLRPNLNGPVQTPTPPISVQPTGTRTPTRTWTATRTRTPTVVRTPSATKTRTGTRTPTGTRTATPTRTGTKTRTPTRTQTATRTATPTQGSVTAPTSTPQKTETRTRTPTKTATATRTVTPTRTLTGTRTPTKTRTPTRTRTPTKTRTPTRTAGI